MPIEDLQELRLALVMTGGVSLAIWMGGATREFDQVIRGENPTYLELLRLTRSLPRIDVIAGTSAGGLNGALLAYAITEGTGVAGLRALWLKLGALEKLLRQPTQANPPSLMLGDDYFLPQLKSAISQLEGPGTDPDDVPMELIITTTLLKPWPRGVTDTFGTIIHDVDHRGEFSFRRGVSLSEDDPTRTTTSTSRTSTRGWRWRRAARHPSQSHSRRATCRSDRTGPSRLGPT